MTKKSSDWEKLNRIFAGAVELAPTQQGAYLADACRGDEDMLREAEAILAASDRAAKQDFLESDAFAAGAKILALSSVDDVVVGRSIGNYKVIKEIGRGGMGAIYLAEREDFQHRVALKIIKRGMDTDEIVRRFEQEREVLAALNHPNIARLLDGGTTADGLPFLVMEYVEGSPLDDFCEQTALNIDERLGLFRKICSAVAYAHQNLIVHRDLKPSNIIVDNDGEPKLLDFGIAKLLTPDSAGQTTETGFRLLTPEYASPEQIRGERVTTTSDIYSLGVLLYELLTGRKPYQITSRNAVEIMRVVCETAPERPSSVVPVSRSWPIVETTQRHRNLTRSSTRVTRTLKGDLDNIILKALQKDSGQRYFSVEQFADDIDRHLNGLPVTARRATYGYQFTKFIERNRTASAFASLALIAILSGSSIAVWQAVVARQERTRAENRLAEIRKLTGNLVSGWDKDIPENQITSLVRGRIADISSGYIEGLANETSDPTILKELAEAYLKLGHEYSWGYVNEEKAKASFKQAESIARNLIAADANDLDAKELLIRSIGKYDEYFGWHDRDESLRSHMERLRLHEEIYAANPNDDKSLAALANMNNSCAWVLKLMGRSDEARPYSQRAGELYQRLLDIREPKATTLDERAKISTLYGMLAINQSDAGNLQPSIEIYRRAASIADTLYKESPDSDTAAGQVASSHLDLGLILKRTGDFRASTDSYRSGLTAVRKTNAHVVDGYLVVKESELLLDLAENYYEMGDNKAAIDTLHESWNAWGKYADLEINKGKTRNLDRTAYNYFLGGKLLARMQKIDEARAAFVRSEAFYLKTIDGEPQRLNNQSLVRLYLTMGDLAAGLGVCSMANSPFDAFSNQRGYCPSDKKEITIKDRVSITKAKKYYEDALTILTQMKAVRTLEYKDMQNLTAAIERVKQVSEKLNGGS
ncbi:MAG: serine/threonine protein kinase [Chloracidobacterium sp.]|nr:serine/threonine protein kinase [Chloracidobacterium sp.]